MKNLINKFENLKSASFITINNYLSTTSGEVANHKINVNISVENAKKTDLNRLQNCNDNDIQAISKASGIDVETIKTALAEMLTSAVKNLSADKTERTNQSQGQTDAYISLTPAIKLHKETLEVHVFGQAISKVVLVKGEYKTVNSSSKTLAKSAIKKHLDLRGDKFRNFILGNADSIKIQGETLELVR